MDNQLSALRKELKRLASPEGKMAAQRFHKEAIECYGIKTPVIKTLAKASFKQIKPLGKKLVFDLAGELFASGFAEEALIACDWVYGMRRNFEAGDLALFERWIKNHVNNWATCDTFCNNSVGSLLLQYPEKLPTLQKWAVAKNRWLQRASAVSLIVPARQGNYLDECFDIADKLIKSEDDLVQKGYGWLLKVASKPNPKQVFAFVDARKEKMPRTALRYAIEHFPPPQKKKLMESSK